MNWLALLAPLWRLLRPLWAPLAGYLQGRRDARAKRDREAKKTFERASNADVGRGDADADRDWLRDRGKR